MGLKLSFSPTFCFSPLLTLYFPCIFLSSPHCCSPLLTVVFLFASHCCSLLYITILLFASHCYSPLCLIALLFALLVSFSPYAVAFLFMSCYYSPFCVMLLLSFSCCTVVICFALRYYSPLHDVLLLSSSHCCYPFHPIALLLGCSSISSTRFFTLLLSSCIAITIGVFLFVEEFFTTPLHSFF
jgi:hypothetical protein